MEITWLGRTCFRLKGRDGSVLMDPCPPESGYRYLAQPAEIVTLSHRDDSRFSWLEGVSGEPLVLDAPGEYEVGGILVTGIASHLPDGGRNVVFVVEIDGIRIGHLGVPAPSHPGLDEVKDVDILLMPVGGGPSLNAAAAADAMTTVDPKVAVPMLYKTDLETMELDPLERFIKETGTKAEPQPKITITRASLPQELTVMLLQPRA